MNSSQPCGGSTLGLLFRQVRDAMWAQMERELAQAGHELTFSQYVALKELTNGPAGVTELARVAQLHPGAMTRLLDRLEERGIVRRVADPDDRRAWRIHMTEAGQSLWTDVSDCGRRVREQAMRGMDADDRERLTALLTQVRDNLTPSGS